MLRRAAKSSRSNAKTSHTPTRGREIRPGDDLLLLVKPNKEGGIVLALQPLIVPEIIARAGMRWWNAQDAAIAGSVVLAPRCHEARPWKLRRLIRRTS